MELKKKQKRIELHCVQCAEKMSFFLDFPNWYVPVCNNAKCPNFGLLQISIEKMNEANSSLRMDDPNKKTVTTEYSRNI